MFEKLAFDMKPVAPKASQIVSGNNRLTILANGLIRLESTPDGQFEDRASTFAINRDLPTPHFDVIRKDAGAMEIVTERLFIQWTGEAFGPNSLLVTLRKKGAGNTGWTNVWRYGDESNTHWSNLGGTFRTLDGVDGRCKLDSGVLSQYGLSILDDSESMLFTDDGWIAGRGKDKTDVYLFAYGLDYREALKTFYTVSGRPPLVPRWSLGNWWSRYYPYSGKEYLGLMDRFRDEGMPLSVAVIDIDWHLMDVPEEFGTAWTGYTWNDKLFPDHVKFLKELHDRQLKSTLNVHPADGVRAFEKAYKDMCKALGRDSSKGVPIPFECADKQFFAEYFKKLHHPLEDEGVDFWWLDWQQGPYSEVAGVDPLWMLNHYHFIDSGRKGDRRFTFSRYAGPGSHRNPIGFSGDTVVSWDSLAFQPEFTATASNIGYGQWSHDIGGHMFGYKDDELMARWVQLGCFSPFLRLHSSDSVFNTREPWAFTRETHDVCAQFLRLRHRLVPYLYSANATACQTYKSLVEPVYYDHPARPEAYAYKNQYTFGSQLLVLPVVAPADKTTRLAKTTGWLPPGQWYDIMPALSGRQAMVYEGDQIVTLYRTLEEYPVLAKQGAIIPLDAAAGADIPNGCPIPEAIEIVLVPGANGSFHLVEDDGTGAEWEQIKLSTTPIKYVHSAGAKGKGELTIGPTTNPLLKGRTYFVRIVGHAVSDVTGGTASASAQNALIELGKQSTSEAITVSFTTTPTALDRKQLIFKRLDRMQWGLVAKETVWKAVNRLDDEPVHKVISRLNAIDADDQVKSVVLEVLLMATE